VIQSKPVDVLMQITSLQGVKTTQTSSHSLEDLEDLSLLYSLLYDMKHTHTIEKNKNLKQKGLERDASHNSSMVLFLYQVICVLDLMYKSALLHLFDLDT
jgi:hypothetical protein